MIDLTIFFSYSNTHEHCKMCIGTDFYNTIWHCINYSGCPRNEISYLKKVKYTYTYGPIFMVNCKHLCTYMLIRFLLSISTTPKLFTVFIIKWSRSSRIGQKVNNLANISFIVLYNAKIAFRWQDSLNNIGNSIRAYTKDDLNPTLVVGCISCF